jgi:ABC-type glycerol-3-phosphate transport system substrate-binding protein
MTDRRLSGPLFEGVIRATVLFSAALVLAAVLSGCLSGEPPLPPDEALAQAARRIDAILAEERTHAQQTPEAGQSERPDSPGTVTFWYPSHPLMSVLMSRPELLTAFNDKRSGIELKAQYIGDWYVAVQKLTVSLAAGDLPDIAVVKRSWLARLIGSGLIAELDVLLPTYLADDLQPEARAAFESNGHLYAFPADGFCNVLYYNRDRVPEPPTTWDDLGRVAEKMGPTDPRANRPVYAVGDLPFIEALWSAGGDICRDGQCGLDAPEAHAALDFILELRNARYAHERAVGNPSGAFDLFLSGGALMTVASSEFLPRVQEARFPVGIAPEPGKSGPISMMSDNAIVVFRRYSEAKHAAIAEALSFLTGPDIQGAQAAARGSMPVRSSVAGQVQAPAGLAEAYACAQSTPLVGAWGAIEFELQRHLSLAYRFDPKAPRPK